MKKLLLLSLLTFALVSGSHGEPTSEWVELHPDADWNKFDHDETQIFEGLLEYEEDPETISFIMRFNPYKLVLVQPGENPGPGHLRLDVYGRSPDLKPFVGKRVQIEGKREQMEVEGAFFDEIWPARVRAR